ncbi:sigma 54-interacting transcriptional regulator [uncultured Desulfovibrio sp.]|uniref:sigma 54-interacting transcriptional regulator n=1 Tax=uncultured Desulfovibrio sp. TaxID=167968 RepID=UPI0026086F76|nr:sigma 54-interacting transcriptional regulator [uncultured Desulfovibrio sp.]
MNQTAFHFAFVSNSLPVAHIVHDYAATRRLPVEIRLASMEEALPVARALLAEGTDVILGGGGTGKLLRRHLQRPVVTIARSHLDILNALLRAREHTDYIACTCYGALPPWPALFAELLNIRLLPVAFTTTQELTAGISQAVDQGVGCVVGGGICAEIAQAQGCRGEVVTPGAEALERALDEALNIARSQQQDREQTAWLRGVLESLHEGIVGVDTEGRPATSNRAAEVLLEGLLDRAATGGSGLTQSLGLTKALQTGCGEEGIIRRINGQELVINTRPILVDGKPRGALAALAPAARLRDLTRKLKNSGRRGFIARHSLDSLLGASPAMRELRLRAARFADADAALHIHGESGTGKELLAHALHQAGPRRNGPFVALNCGALPDSLLESELFGYDEGAFTGARRGGKEGLFEMAQDGSIFLDEIADISPAVQIRLLRVLETGEIFRLGGDRPIAVNARVISSSWKDLVEEVRCGRFRADLYYRLSLLRLYTPPLRERPEDIPLLARHILARMNMAHKELSPAALGLLKDYAWPGNVRELDALLRRYCLLSDGQHCDKALLEKLLDDLRATQGLLAPAEQPVEKVASLPEGRGSLKERLESLERDIIRAELEKCEHNRGRAARNLGISANTLWRKMKAGPR